MTNALGAGRASPAAAVGASDVSLAVQLAQALTPCTAASRLSR
ncbi:hypothetical protein [Phenylobacterium sp.]